MFPASRSVGKVGYLAVKMFIWQIPTWGLEVDGQGRIEWWMCMSELSEYVWATTARSPLDVVGLVGGF